jgi:hypothetical protein
MCLYTSFKSFNFYSLFDVRSSEVLKWSILRTFSNCSNLEELPCWHCWFYADMSLVRTEWNLPRWMNCGTVFTRFDHWFVCVRWTDCNIHISCQYPLCCHPQCTSVFPRGLPTPSDLQTKYFMHFCTMKNFHSACNTKVYSQNHGICGRCPSYEILNIKNPNISELDLFPSSGEGRETSTSLDPYKGLK